jgi:hypothetical protein
MTEEDLRRILQEFEANHTVERRASPDTESIRITAIYAYFGIAAIAGGFILWLSSLIIDQKNRPLADDQLIMKQEIKANKELGTRVERTMNEGFAEIKTLIREKK